MPKDHILIVGGAGYIGAHVSKLLAQKQFIPVTLDNLVYGHEESVRWGPLIKGSAGDAALVKKIFKDYKIRAVMHFAAYAYVGESVLDPGKYYLNNVAETLTLLNTMQRQGVDCFVFSSTCAIYGEPEEYPITETCPRCPVNPYGRSKKMVEEILQDFDTAYGLRYASLRYFNAAGASPQAEIGEDHSPETHLIPLLLDTALGRRESVSIYGTDYDTPDGTCIRDYIHVSDLARAHLQALEHLLQGGASLQLNLGNGKGYSVSEVIQSVRQVTGRKVDTVAAPRRPGDPPCLVGSSEKARQILAWQPEIVTLNEIVKTAWNWHCKKWG